MTEAIIFSLDLLLLGAGGALALSALVVFGGVRRNAPALLALGLYGLLAGLALALAPQLLWERARTDNAFLGHVAFTLIMMPVGLLLTVAGVRALRGQERAEPTASRAVLVALAGLALLLVVLVARGPAAWQTGSGQFGLDIIAVTVGIGGAIFLLGRRLGGAAAGPADGAPRLRPPLTGRGGSSGTTRQHQ